MEEGQKADGDLHGGSEGKKGDGMLKERPETAGVRRGPNRFEERREIEERKKERKEGVRV
jgi:hypothetical protein